MERDSSLHASRWWHLAVVAVCALVGALAIVNESNPVRDVAAIALLAVLLLAWFTVGSRSFESPGLALGFTLFLIVVAGTGTAINPNFATLQCIIYPLVWVLSPNGRAAVVANVAVALAVAVGFIVRFGPTPDVLLEAFSISALSLAFSLAMGTWITHIWRRSDERQALLDELQSTQQQLSAVSRDAGVASERERLAREIHDTIAQDLTGLVLLTQQARRQLAAGETTEAEEQLALLEESARLALGETRALVAATSPTALDEGGIAPALGRLAERFSRETGIDVSCTTEVDAPLDRATEVVLLRCAQEGLANVRKHSAAASAQLALTVSTHGTMLSISDDGTGFDENEAGGGFGLAGMRERLALVAGTLEISSSPAGTRLTATLPAVVVA